MYRHYLKSNLRHLIRQKAYVALGVAGLSAGLTCCLLISLWILDELSFDRFHEGADRIHLVLAHGTIKNNPSTPVPLAPALEEEIPEIVAAARYESLGQVLLGRGDTRLYQSQVRAVDPAFFEIFSFELLQGDPATALATPDSIVISESVARKFFGDENPLGETLTYNDAREAVVGGVFRALPRNSTLNIEVAVPYRTRISDAEADGNRVTWGWFSPLTFVRICDPCSADDVNAKIEGFMQRHAPEEDVRLSILPLTEMRSMFTDSAVYVRVYSVVAVFVLAIACINYVNLATARSATRAREIGIRKSVGASRGDLLRQFLLESGLLTLASGIVALALAGLSVPIFNQVTGKEVSLDFMRYPALLPVFVGLMLLTAAASGAYPAFVATMFPPTESLRGRLSSSGNVFLRRCLIAIQFSLAIFLFVGTAVVQKQLGFLQRMDVGYERDHLITIPLKGSSRPRYAVMKEHLLRDPDVLAVTGMLDSLPYFGSSTGTADWPGKNPGEETLIYFNLVDLDLIETTGIRLIKGRDFSREHPADVGSRVLINETLARIMGIDTAVGSTITLWDQPREVIGVVKDFHFQPMQAAISPLVLLLEPSQVNAMLVRVRSGSEQGAVEAIRRTFRSVAPLSPPTHGFVRDQLDASHDRLRRMGILAGGFTLLAIVIACLGVAGLSSYAAERRAREIGVRKVLGASVAQIVRMMSREQVVLVGIANLVSWPPAYLVMSRLLEAYAYRVDIGWAPFAMATALALAVTLLTSVPLAARAASRNPVEVLRYE